MKRKEDKNMEKIVVATTNKNKVKRIKELLKGLNYEVLSLEDFNANNIEEPNETKNTPVEIAIEKALHYAKYLPENTIILTQDDTISFEGVREEDNPGMHIKRPVVKKYGEFTDELAAKYYKELADKYGGAIPMTFNYGHAIAIKTREKRNIIKVCGAVSKLEVRLVNRINKLESVPGYFLAALMEANIGGEWVPYNDLKNDELVRLDADLYDSITTLLKNI